VEGANILTRSMIVFGQGVVRCHPFVHREMRAIETGNLVEFDRAFFGHLNFLARNFVRALGLGLTSARLARAPVAGTEARHYRDLTRFSADFALIADAALAMFGGGLKRREKISGRLADALAWMYLGSAALKRFHDDGCPDRDRAVLDWSCALALWEVQTALVGVLDNLPSRCAAAVLRRIVFPLGLPMRAPSDHLGAQVARGLLDGGALREHLTTDIFLPRETDTGLGRLEAALVNAIAARDAKQKIRQAVRAGELPGDPVETSAERARQAGVIDDSEFRCLSVAEKACDAAIAVDEFEPEAYHALKG
jgi:acyl-CoA dehydrogenase